GAVLLGCDLAVQIGGHAIEIGDHALDLRDAAPLLVDLKFPQANERFTRLHRLLLPRSLPHLRARHPANGPTQSILTMTESGSTTLVFSFRSRENLLQPHIPFGKLRYLFLILPEE